MLLLTPTSFVKFFSSTLVFIMGSVSSRPSRDHVPELSIADVSYGSSGVAANAHAVS